MLGRVRQWFRALFRGEAAEQQREIVDLATQAKAYPDNERLILRLGDCYLRAGDKERALSAYWHVVDLYKKRHDWQKSAAVLKRISLLVPGEMIARFELAQCFEKLERRREAAQQWEQAGDTLKNTGDLEGTVRCYERAVALDPMAAHLVGELLRLRPPQAAKVVAPPPKITSVPKLAPLPKLQPAPVEPAPPSVRPNLASLGRAQARDELPAMTSLDNPLDAFDLGMGGDSTREYAAEELGTLLEDDFDADTVAVESLPAFDEEHRPAQTPSLRRILRS